MTDEEIQKAIGRDLATVALGFKDRIHNHHGRDFADQAMIAFIQSPALAAVARELFKPDIWGNDR